VTSYTAKFTDPENMENIPLRSGHKTLFSTDDRGVEFDRISVASASCDTPKIETLDFNVWQIGQNRYETGVRVQAYCAPKGTKSERVALKDANVTYTDPAQQQYLLTMDAPGSYGMQIKGNVENLPITDGHKEYHAVGFLHTVEDPHVSIQSSTCADPKLTGFYFYTDRDEAFYNGGRLPKKVTFDGNITNTQTGSMLSGALRVDWRNAASIDLTQRDPLPVVDVHFSGLVKRTGYKDMTLMLGFNNENEKSRFSFSYAYDATAINGTGLFDKEMQNGSITLHSHNGIEAEIAVAGGKVLYGEKSSVTRDGRKIGELQERASVPVIKYTDGTFESLP